MGLTNGLALAFLVALVIPFLLERLRRRRADAVSFSALHFMLREQTRFQRVLTVRRHVLPLIRVLVLGALVLYFARPYMHGEARVAAGLTPDTAAVLVLDNGGLSRLEIEGRSLLSRAKEAAQRIARGKAAGARVAVMPLAGGAAEGGSLFHDELVMIQQRIGAIAYDAQVGDPARVWEAARDALARQDAARRVVFWIAQEAAPEAPPAGSGIEIVVLPPVPGRRLQGPVIRSVKQVRGALLVALENLSELAYEGSAELSGGRRRGLQRVPVLLSPWEQRELMVPALREEDAFGVVRLEPANVLARYQQRFFHQRSSSGGQDRVFLVSAGGGIDPARDPMAFIRQGLRTTGRANLLSLVSGALDDEQPERGDLVFMAVPGEALAGLAGRVRQLTDRGLVVWVELSSEPPPNTTFHGVTLIGESREARVGVRSPGIVADDLAPCLDATRVSRVVLATGHEAAGYRALASSRAGIPLLIGRRLGRGYLALELSGLTPARTDLPLNPCFAPWLRQVLTHIDRETFTLRKTVYEVGDALTPSREGGVGRVTLLLPDGRDVDLRGEPYVLEEIGRHRVRSESGGVFGHQDFVVNPRVTLERELVTRPQVEASAPRGEGTTVGWQRVDLSYALWLLLAALLVVELIVSAIMLWERPRASAAPTREDASG
jgi:hypothetical protein